MDRHRAVFDRLKNDWEILEQYDAAGARPRPAAYTNQGRWMADHYGVPIDGTMPEGAAQR